MLFSHKSFFYEYVYDLILSKENTQYKVTDTESAIIYDYLIKKLS
jgi:hypothetical protein